MTCEENTVSNLKLLCELQQLISIGIEIDKSGGFYYYANGYKYYPSFQYKMSIEQYCNVLEFLEACTGYPCDIYNVPYKVGFHTPLYVIMCTKKFFEKTLLPLYEDGVNAHYIEHIVKTEIDNMKAHVAQTIERRKNV